MTTKYHLVVHTPGNTEEGIKNKAVDLIISGLMVREGLKPEEFKFSIFTSCSSSFTLMIVSHSCYEVLDRVGKLIVATLKESGAISLEDAMLLDDRSLRLLQICLCKDVIQKMLSRNTSPFIIVEVGKVIEAMAIEPVKE